ncbi:hemicentin-2-like isoform X4 [Scyliorhinus torazame]|uniref:hemicentin-2-like isoform X4 n=1 Tax=Scyliorhinus torazame TaxID=75743 RepID=UPI003B5C7831
MLLIPAAMDKRAVYIHIVPAVLAFWIQPAIVTGFEITLNTNPPAVEFGASFEMNCTTTCPDPIINVEYKPGIHPNRTTGSNWITDYFPSVQAWDFTAPCNMICKSQNNSADEQKKVVTVYNREINITSPPEVLEVNRTYSLECIGPRVYPNNKLILTWLRGSETLQINSTGEQGFPDEDIRLRNVFSFTASVSDDGQEYTCLAEVDLGSNSTKPIANCSVTLRAHYKPGDTTISVNNKTVSGFPVTVRKGDEVTMICNSNGNPTPTLKWEDPSNSSNVEIGSPGVLRISHATSGHQGIYQCRATNRYGIEEKEVDIRVTDKPGDTTISVNNKTVSGFLVTVRKGDEVTMICNSNGNPTPTLKWEDPSNSSNVEIGSPGVLRISHATSGHQGIYKCRATNRYGIEEKEVDIRVTAAIVTGFEITLNTNPPAVEFGASLEMNCTTTCPDPIINVEYKPGIHPNRTTGSNWITDYFPSVQAWDFTAPCNMICKSQNNRAAEQKVVLTVYNREINITSPPEVLEVNRTYSLECIGPRVYPNNKLILTWLRGSETLQINSTGEQGFPDEDIRLRNVFSFTASVSDDGQEYTCLAEVDLGSNSTKPIANCSVTLRAHYKPGDTTISVNNKTVSGFPVTVRKGDEVTMICNSNGNPTPTLKWEDPSNSSNVEIGSPGVLRISHATSGHQGIYQCRATNRYGIEEKEVDIRVTDKPGDTTISVNNKTVSGFPVTVRKGDEVTMICNSNGNPTPTLKWEDPSNSSNVEIGSPGVLRISHATSGHQGIYKCRATNRYGIEEKEVDIRVTAIVTGFEITLNTNPPAVEFGASFEMNCTTTCPDPIINVEYKPGIHPNRTTGSNWITDYFPSVQAWDFTAPCNMICKSQNNSADEQKKVVTVYNREINITSPPEVLEVNRTYSLECIGPRVYPNNKLILTWLRGSETLQINSTGEQGFPDEDIRLRNVFSFTASVSDDGQEYTCLAEVDLGSNSTKPIANCSVTLRAHYKPGDTTISVNNKTVSGFPVTVRKGDEVTMICNSNGNPTPTLKWEDPSNSSNVEIGSPGVLRISHATSGHQGVYKCRATNRYGIEEKEVDIRVTAAIVTGFEITLNTNPPAVEFGASLEMNCTTTCPDPIINVEYKPGIHPNRTTGSNWITDYFPSVQAWDFTAPCNMICKSQNNRAAEQKVVVTVYNREINITSPPEVLEVNRTYSLECIGPRVYPNNKLILTWLRGSETLQINSTGEQGFPDEDIRLRNVFSFTASVSDDGQEYTCLAEVDLGSNSTKPIANCSVTLRAHYKPGDTTISVNNKTVSGFPVTVRKGDEVTMICNSNGNPTPTLKWEDPSNSSNVEIGSPGVLRISHATSGHQGVYKCRATNRYGIEEKEVDIRVTGQTSARRLAAKFIGLTSVVIVAGAFLLSILSVLFQKIEIKTE